MNPDREEQAKSLEQRERCKICPVCKMVFCKYHMEDSKHLQDCNFRSNQEREILEEQRNEAIKQEQERKAKLRQEELEQKEFEEKEKIRKQIIADRNQKAKYRG